MLPPGWMTATAPLSATTSRPSRNGKNASEATTEPASDRPAVLRLDRGDARRIDAAHLPRADAERAARPQKTIAFDFTNFATRHANRRSAQLRGVGAARDDFTTLASVASRV